MMNGKISVQLLCSMALGILVVASDIAMESKYRKPVKIEKDANQIKKDKKLAAAEKRKIEQKKNEIEANIALDQKLRDITNASTGIIKREITTKQNIIERKDVLAEKIAYKNFCDDLNSISSSASVKCITNDSTNSSPIKLTVANKYETFNKLNTAVVQYGSLRRGPHFYGEEITPTAYIFNNEDGKPFASIEVSPTKTITRDKYGTPIKSIKSGSSPIWQAIAFNKAIRDKDVNAIQALSRNSVLDNTYPSYILLKGLVNNKISKKEWQELELHSSMITNGERLTKQNFIEVAIECTNNKHTRELLSAFNVISPVKNPLKKSSSKK